MAAGDQLPPWRPWAPGAWASGSSSAKNGQQSSPWSNGRNSRAIIPATQRRESVPRQPATTLSESRLFLSFEGAAHGCSSRSVSQNLVTQELLQRCPHSTLSPAPRSPPLRPLPRSALSPTSWAPSERRPQGAAWIRCGLALRLRRSPRATGAGTWERTGHSVRVAVTERSVQTTEGKSGCLKVWGKLTSN